ncbi:type-1 angiotensin II receptor B-like [Physella acuta]|uniref:type-1 angiotensin II receptor B-like n=1 Tax=Physella acuta TaxID=109671 RepID=UPI0027DBFB00|nr:type-1 angiotensin II receptor B-like [Physella acuta]
MTSAKSLLYQYNEVSTLASSLNLQPEFMNYFQRTIVVLVNRIFLCALIGLFGIVANVINIRVFLSQGLNNSVNICFLAVAFTDLFRIVTVQWMNVCSNPLIDQLNAPIIFQDIQYLTGGWPHACAIRITIGITAYITAERCLCILLPLKIKTLITPKRTSFILLLIYLFNFLALVPEYATVYFDWRFNLENNKTLLGLAFRENRPAVQGLAFMFHGTISMISLIAVIAFTSVLVVKLKVNSKWRKSAVNLNLTQTDLISNRDKNAIALVVTVATVLIICYTPIVIFSLVSTIVPDFSVSGRQANLFHATWSFGFLFSTFNASINIFLYYKMSSKYRKHFHSIFLDCCFSFKPLD